MAPRIVETIKSREIRSLTEPFAGVAAVSFMYRQAGGTAPIRLYDLNGDLVSLHRSVVEGRDFFVSFAETIWEALTPDRYMEARRMFNSRTMSEYAQAALFLWMNKHGFNGLCRYNRSGEFNVPVGRQSQPPKLPKEEMLMFARAFKTDTIDTACFSETMTLERSAVGDLFYCDPPYIGDGFVGYVGGGFSLEQQCDLARRARMLADNGRFVIVSNASSPLALEVYSGADQIDEAEAPRSISRNPDGRKAAKEIIARYGI